MTNALLRLDGRTVLITGGGTGIGAATARVLAEHGADVALAGRTPETLERTARSIGEETGRRVVTIVTDVHEQDQVRALIEGAVEALDGIDVLVNNAGGAYLHPLTDMTPNRWDRAVSLNMRSAYLCSYFARDALAASDHAAIVNISSLAGVHGVVNGAAYSAAKAGLQMFTRVVAAEWGPDGIRCNAVAPGRVATEGAIRSWERMGATPQSQATGIPLGRVGRPEDIAHGVLFLASDMSSWVSGQVLAIDGGPSSVTGGPTPAA